MFDSPTSTTSTTENHLPPKENHPFLFNGEAGEYFKIWFVNTVFTILTLGIYSAWAKVRKRRYFYGATSVAGSTFDFHANPIAILKGRLILGALLIAYLLGGHVSGYIPLLALLAFFVLFPWMIVRGMMFNLANTSYRGIRFGFTQDIKGAYKTFILGYLVALFTLGFGTPYYHYLYYKFLASNSRYGKVSFIEKYRPGEFFYIIYIPVVSCFAAFGVIAALSHLVLGPQSTAAAFIPLLSVGLGVLVISSYIAARTYNYRMGNLRLGEARFVAQLEVRTLMGIYFTNALAMGASFGLATPWCQIRLARYKSSRVHLRAPQGALEKMEADQASPAGAVADAASDFLNIDLGF